MTAFLTERVARYKVPRHVLFFAAGELPTTSSDAKVRDDELIAMATGMLAADGPATDPEADTQPAETKER